MSWMIWISWYLLLYVYIFCNLDDDSHDVSSQSVFWMSTPMSPRSFWLEASCFGGILHLSLGGQDPTVRRWKGSQSINLFHPRTIWHHMAMFFFFFLAMVILIGPLSIFLAQLPRKRNVWQKKFWPVRGLKHHFIGVFFPSFCWCCLCCNGATDVLKSFSKPWLKH